MIDVHAHIACIDQKKNGCFISPKMIKNIRYRYYLRSLGVKQADIDDGSADGKIIKSIVKLIQESKRLKQAIILAMEGAINSQGERDSELTEV